MNAITSRIELNRLAAAAITHGCGHTAELLFAAARGEIEVAFLLPSTLAPMKRLRRATRPAIVVVGDDPGDAGLGPTGWAASRRLVEWAGFGVIHAAGGTVADYRRIVAMAKIHRRLLLIECASGHADAWAAVLVARQPRPVPLIGVLPRSGAHPVTMDGAQ